MQKDMFLGIVMGNPQVFLGNPCPYPPKTTPAHTGTVFDGYGSRVGSNPRAMQASEGLGSHVVITTNLAVSTIH